MLAMVDFWTLESYKQGDATNAEDWHGLHLNYQFRLTPEDIANEDYLGGVVDDATIKVIDAKFTDWATQRTNGVQTDNSFIKASKFWDDTGGSGTYNGKSFAAPNLDYVQQIYDSEDKAQRTNIGKQHGNAGTFTIRLKPVKYIAIMPNWIRVVCQGGYDALDGSEVYRSVEEDYVLLNRGTAASPDWRVVAIAGQFISHHTDLVNKGKTGFATAEEDAFVLHWDEFTTHTQEREWGQASHAVMAPDQEINTIRIDSAGISKSTFFKDRAAFATSLQDEYNQVLSAKSYFSSEWTDVRLKRIAGAGAVMTGTESQYDDKKKLLRVFDVWSLEGWNSIGAASTDHRWNKGDPSEANSWHSIWMVKRERKAKNDGSCCEVPTGAVFYGAVDDAAIKQVRERLAAHVKRRTTAIKTRDNTPAFVTDEFIDKGDTNEAGSCVWLRV